jgi:hypothetical protein
MCPEEFQKKNLIEPQSNEGVESMVLGHYDLCKTLKITKNGIADQEGLCVSNPLAGASGSGLVREVRENFNMPLVVLTLFGNFAR